MRRASQRQKAQLEKMPNYTSRFFDHIIPAAARSVKSIQTAMPQYVEYVVAKRTAHVLGWPKRVIWHSSPAEEKIVHRWSADGSSSEFGLPLTAKILYHGHFRRTSLPRLHIAAAIIKKYPEGAHEGAKLAPFLAQYAWSARGGHTCPIVLVRPPEFVRLKNNELHCDDGPAVRWADGYAEYWHNGKLMERRWNIDKAKYAPADIFAIRNAEFRALACQGYGWENLITQENSRVIDDSGDPDIGKLVEVDIGREWPGRFLVAECPRNGTIYEGVPEVSDIDGKPIDTALAAQAWRVGMAADEYVHPKKRT